MPKASCVLLIDKINKLFLSVSLKTDKTDFNLPENIKSGKIIGITIINIV